MKFQSSSSLDTAEFYLNKGSEKNIGWQLAAGFFIRIKIH